MTVSPALRWVAYGLLALTALAWAGNMVLARGVSDSVPPVALAFWRWLVAGTLLTLLFGRRLLRNRAALFALRGRIVALSVSGMTIFHTLQYTGLGYTTAVNAAIIIAGAPVIVILLQWLVQGQRPAVLEAVGTVLSVVGVAIVVLDGTAGLTVNVGDAMLLVAAISWAVYSMLAMRPMTDLDQATILTATVLVTVVLLAPVYLIEHLYFERARADATMIASVGYVALVASILAYFCFNAAVRIVGPVMAGLCLNLIPVFVILLALVILGERIGSDQMVGAALILIALVLATVKRLSRRTESAGEDASAGENSTG